MWMNWAGVAAGRTTRLLPDSQGRASVPAAVETELSERAGPAQETLIFDKVGREHTWRRELVWVG